MITPEPSAPEPSERDALRKKIMERMRPLCEHSSQWNGWPGTWEFAEAALQAIGAALKPSPSPVVVEPTAAARDVLAERLRQISAEGWTPDHDDEHHTGDLAKVAAAYAVVGLTDASPAEAPAWFPWDEQWWKPKGHRRNLVKAGALILAEIERLDRIGPKRPEEGKS